MKKTLIGFALLMLVVAACAPQSGATEQPAYPNGDSYPNETSYPSDSPSHLTPAQRAAITALARTLNLPPEQITLISTESVEWPDGCLGVQKIGMMCTQAVVPGYKIVLQANRELYEFHTDEDGSQAVQVVTDSASASIEAMLIQQLASNLGLQESDISVVSSSDVEFADACLGVAMNEMMCAQVITPGKIVVLESAGVQYEYHVSNDGALVQPATLALTWSRTGGIAGFCDNLTIFLSGEVYGNQCKNTDGRMESFTSLFSASEQKQFGAWITEFSQENLDASDPEGVSDSMTVTLILFGRGNGKPGRAEKEMILNWAQELYQRLYT